MMPKISVLMPVYNAEAYLAEAIDSILNQGFSDWEFIIINDGSDDKSEAIIQSYTDARIRYYKNETNLGLIATLNKGVTLCTAKYIARMDADDIALTRRLELQYAFLEANTAYAMCGGDALVVDNEGKETGHIKNLYSTDLLKVNLLFSVPFIHPAVMIRRVVFDELAYDTQFKHVEDYDLWCNVARKWDVANIPSNIIKYRWHNTNVSVLNQSQQIALKDTIICRELKCLNLKPSEEELYFHKITFQLYAKGEKLAVSVNDFTGVEVWFSKLIKQNKVLKVYPQTAFISFIWSRWAVLCVSQKKYFRILFPQFASYKPKTLFSTFKLILFLSKK